MTNPGRAVFAPARRQPAWVGGLWWLGFGLAVTALWTSLPWR